MEGLWAIINYTKDFIYCVFETCIFVPSSVDSDLLINFLSIPRHDVIL